ncbi:MAG: aminomethyl-transferring glycine dehydrogenase [Bacteroidales bacterium]|nr:aminomethyl-transferring glycine dehydrogenase [Bacteroidales bacterium]MCF8403966.1 aminomethyl-transferring glycine dehydrogenase [Bacteroidales bacterium]
MISNNFIHKHNGPRKHEVGLMLEKMGSASIDELIEQTVPASIRLKTPLGLPKGINEYEYINHLKDLASKNKIFKSLIGMGYYNTIVPGVIQRNILENPGWYTSYTPYQAEISQGRLEALLNFQTMVAELTAMPLANASLLDEGTAAAEAMIMLYNSRSRASVKANKNTFLISDKLFPQTIEVIKTRAYPLKINLVIGDVFHVLNNDDAFGAIVQYPDNTGEILDYKSLCDRAHENEIGVVVATDLLSLTLLTPPGEWGADVVVGTSQRFGIPMGFGGPHAAFFATTENYKRNIPGRIIGISKDANGNRALRMALQTREQHIKRERATSNICTAQALLASMAGFYAAYHGPDGLKNIALDIHQLTALLANTLIKFGYKIKNNSYFDTLTIEIPDGMNMDSIRNEAVNNRFNLHYINESTLSVSIDETVDLKDIKKLLSIFAFANNKDFKAFSAETFKGSIPENLQRTSEYLTNEVFNTYHSETEMMRYMKYLENKDLALNRTMIPLGSCTMKLNAAAELFSLSWPEFGEIHPFAPADQVQGYLELISDLEKDLCQITGFDAVSFQPNSGASGEYAGLLVIKAYLDSIGQGHRHICLIPASAHGTNPASSVMAGMDVVVVKCDEHGNIDLSDLEEKAKLHSENLAAIMITYPSTHGVFEEGILKMIDIVHQNGGQVYMDGANMNAQVGLTNPAIIGADVCHLNLHKTFAIPHGGGGPGVGPIGVAAHLKPFLPSHPLFQTGGEKGITALSSAPFGSALILPISYGYIKLLGGEGLTEATKIAILNANYIKTSLEKEYKILYSGKNNRVAHEMILDCNEFLKTANITVIDIAKRLMDFGFHAPTVAFPVHGTLMVEPTESEPLSELDRFIEAMKIIQHEIRDIESGKLDDKNNVVKNAPHTLKMVTLSNWEYTYDKKQAAFPVENLLHAKYWPPVTKIDDAYGDRNLICTCQPIEAYE